MDSEAFFRIKSWSKLIGLLYLFILSIEILKKFSGLLAPQIKNFLLFELNPIKAVCAGWFATSVAQSSGAVASLASSLAGSGAISITMVVYILVGAILGTTITPLIISLITKAKDKKDFRHGFEIAICYSIYTGLLVVIVFILEYFLKFFSRSSVYLANLTYDKIAFLKIPGVVDIVTFPILALLNSKIDVIPGLLIGFLLLIFTIRLIGHSVVEVLGGKEKTRLFINKNFKSKTRSYILGVVITGVIFSSSVTIGLLVPLAASRVISLKKSIPFILGANLGTTTDVILAALIIGNPNALATAIVLLSFSIIGSIIFLPNTEFLFKSTKYLSKKLLKVSREKAFYLLLAFILIPLLILLLF